MSEKAVFDTLVPWLSEEAAVTASVKAEIALLKVHLEERGLLTDGISRAIDESAGKISAEEVYAEEEKTHHNIRALVNVLKKYVPTETAPFVHLGATSVDILDTSLSYRMKGVTLSVVLPLLRGLLSRLCAITDREADTAQVGRTHGQHAVPITVGFAFAEYVSRLGKCVVEIEARAKSLRGKLSGAVGAYNAMSMIVKDPEAFEKKYLAALGLEPSEHSTQLVEPEYLLRLLLEFNTAFGVIANLADDLRHLQRSEIGELREGFSDAQVGSSTMPQKRNPWNCEHVKSLWKAFSPRVVTFYMDQISEHQRDLTNSASQRFTADYVAGFCLAVSRMTGVLDGLSVNKDSLAANLKSAGGGVLAEPAYILLSESGESDAHEVIRKITLSAQRDDITFSAALMRDERTFKAITKKMIELGLVKDEAGAVDFFGHPERYSGLAAKKAREIARSWQV
jgi:adenylosuccinate lyase